MTTNEGSRRPTGNLLTRRPAPPNVRHWPMPVFVSIRPTEVIIPASMFTRMLAGLRKLVRAEQITVNIQNMGPPCILVLRHLRKIEKVEVMKIQTTTD